MINGRKPAVAVLASLILLFAIFTQVSSLPSSPQLQQSGGAGGTTNVAQFGGSNVTLGQKAMSASIPMVLASDQSAVPISGTVTANQGGAPWSINNTQINGVPFATGNGAVSTGVQRVAIASDNTAFSVNAVQSGTFTVTPANTANTTPWFVKQVPLHGCAGNTLQDITSVDVATGGGTAATSADTCVFYVYANNKTGNTVTLTIQDKSGTPVVYSTTFSIPPNSDVRRDFGGHKFLGGVQLIAGTPASVNVITYGVQ